MKYCSKCGAEIHDEAVICVKCGCSVAPQPQTQVAAPAKQKDNTLETVTKVFMILACVAQGWLLIPLAWCIPMTVSVFHSFRDKKPIGTGMIVSEDERHAVLAAVAVIPDYRHRGIGTEITRYLVNRILEKGKIPCLISGYDAVAELYRQVGFQEEGRWGEWYR